MVIYGGKVFAKCLLIRFVFLRQCDLYMVITT